MRHNRIRNALLASALTAAAALAAAPASAESSAYDGLWNVTVVTKSRQLRTDHQLDADRDGRQGLGRWRRRFRQGRKRGTCASLDQWCICERPAQRQDRFGEVEWLICRRTVQWSMGSVAAISRIPPAAIIAERATADIRSRRVFFGVDLPAPLSYAESGAFAGMAGNWSGGGTITLDDGSSERVRCRASYAVRADGNAINQTLTCASDSFKFNLASNVVAQGTALSGTWSESIRNASGNLEGRGGGGHFHVIASGAGFTAQISLTTRGNKQSVVIKSEGAFRVTSISLTRS